MQSYGLHGNAGRSAQADCAMPKLATLPSIQSKAFVPAQSEKLSPRGDKTATRQSSKKEWNTWGTKQWNRLILVAIE
jgi:hypothetical protein